jgi:RHS repeat-associated protein
MMNIIDSANTKNASFSGYNAFGQPGEIDFQNGAKTTLSYDPYTSRLTELKTTASASAPVQDFTYGYDNNGNILSITDNVEANNSQTFTYDWLNRLATAGGPYGAINYNTDRVGNAQNPPDTANTSYTGDQALVYDYENRLLSVGGNTFTYDYRGARVKKNDTTYVSKIFEVSATGGITKHIFAGGRRIASIMGSNVYYYHLDHLGSLSVVTDDATQGPVQAVTYYPYGEVRTNTRSLQTTDLPSVDLPYKFTGHELDNETGLYYCGARYYDASQGRFLTPDTIVQSPGDPQSLNRYAYARNNPLAFVDPSGHYFIQDIIIACLMAVDIETIALGAAAGAVLGANLSAITGGNPLTGALTGAVAGGLFAGAGNIIQTLPGVAGAGALTDPQLLIEASLIHAGAGGASGAIGAAIGGGKVGLGALTGAISGGVAEGLGLAIQGSDWFSKLQPDEKIFAGLASRVGIGAVTGGVTSEIVNGQFLHGFGQGAWTAAYGFLFNQLNHIETVVPYGVGSDQVLEKTRNSQLPTRLST